MAQNKKQSKKAKAAPVPGEERFVATGKGVVVLKKAPGMKSAAGNKTNKK